MIEATLLFHLDELRARILLLDHLAFLVLLLLVQLLYCYLLQLAGSIQPGPFVDSAPYSSAKYFVVECVVLSDGRVWFRLHGFGMLGGKKLGEEEQGLGRQLVDDVLQRLLHVRLHVMLHQVVAHLLSRPQRHDEERADRRGSEATSPRMRVL